MNKLIDKQFLIDKNNVLVCYIEQEGVTDIVIPDGITGIGYGAFIHRKNLNKITIPDSVTEIGDFAFAGCTSLTSVNIPDKITKIDIFTFEDCTNLTEITIPDSVTEIYPDAFKNCNNIKIINGLSYKLFTILDDDLKVIALNIIIKNKQQFSEEEINTFAEYIIENKIKILKCIIKRSYLKDLLTFMLNDVYMFYTEKEINSILNEMDKQIDIETKSMLLKYSNKTKNTSINQLDEYDLGDFEEDLDKKIK